MPPAFSPDAEDVRVVESKGSRLCQGMLDEPLVVDWTKEQRNMLVRALEHVALVRVSCPTLEVVQCTSYTARYAFEPATAARAALHFDRGPSLNANLPYAAGSESEAVDIAFASVGRFVQRSKVERGDLNALSGEGCNRATHYVRALWVGAYRVSAGARGKASTFHEIYGIDATDAGAEADERVLLQDGTLTSCDHTEATAKPPGRCRAPIRVELAPLGRVPHKDIYAAAQCYGCNLLASRADVPTRKTTSTRSDPRTWYPQPGQGPIPLTVGARRLLIGLAWARESNEVDVVALDRETFEEVWTETGFAIQWSSDVAHLRVVGDRVVLSDDHGDVHVLDALTGDLVRAVRFRGRVRSMCTPGDGSRRLLVAPQEGAPDVHVLDIDTGAVSPAAKTEHCSRDVTYETRLGPIDDSVLVRASEKRFRGRGTLAEGDHRVVVGTVGLRSRTEDFAIGWDATTRRIGWEGRLVAPDDVATRSAPSMTAISGARLFHVYRSELGERPYRLVARSSRTGALLYVVDVTAGEHAWIRALTFAGGAIYLVMGEVLIVLDAATGKQRRFLNVL